MISTVQRKSRDQFSSPDLDWVLILERAGKQPVGSGENVLIRCLNPDHPDHNPSCSVNRHTGQFLCWSCGFKGGPKKLLAILKGVDVALDTTSLEEDLEVITKKQWQEHAKQVLFGNTPGLQEAFLAPVSLPYALLPWHKPWKMVTEATCTRFGLLDGGSQIIVPVQYKGQWVGWYGRALPEAPFGAMPHEFWPYKEKGTIHWTQVVLYPDNQDIPAKQDIFLVEGFRDVLRLIELGLHAFALCGTQNWSMYKVRELLSRQPRRVILCFDGDAAGWKTTAEFTNGERPLVDYINVRPLCLPAGLDPAEMESKEQIEKLLADPKTKKIPV